MNDFTTTADLKITNNPDEAALLFEQIETFATALRFRVQEKNEIGRWGGRGTDAEFTIYYTDPTQQEVIEVYREQFYYD